MSKRPDKIKFHPGFYGATELEFRLEKSKMEFNREYNLSKEPLRIDLLILKDNEKLENEVGRLFKKYNIIEYKSPDDGLTVDDLFKTLGYACLYKALGSKVDEISEKQITVSLFRDAYPSELFKYLKETGRCIEKRYSGVYYIKGNLQFDMQVVVMNQLDADRHSIFRALSKNAKEDDIRRFLEEISTLTNKGDKGNAEAVLHVSVLANKQIYANMRRNAGMYKALEDLMQDVIVKREEAAAEKAEKKGIKKGALEASRSVAKNMLSEGADMNFISRVTNLPLEEIKKLA